MPEKKIIIVDDEEDFVGFLEKRLLSVNFIVQTAYCGMEAVNKIKQAPPDLILMDIILPDIDGADAVRLLQADPNAARIPLIFLSGIVTNERAESSASIKIGDRTYPALGKPFTFEELMEEIREIFT